jgi:PAS domain S-box-containing protein
MAEGHAPGIGRWLAVAAAIFSAAVVLAFTLAADRIVRLRGMQAATIEQAQIAGTLRARIEQDLTATILLQKGLAVQFAVNPAMTSADFEAVARDLLIGARNVRNFGFAHGTVITDVYPKLGNEILLGLDYRTLPDQWPAIERAIMRRESVLAGPLELRQGGVGVVGRTPVFASPPGAPPGSGPFLGVVSVVVTLERLFETLGLEEIEKRHTIALRGTDGRGASGATFRGDAALFGSGAIVADVSLPGGTWQLAVAQRGDRPSPTGLEAVWGLGGAAALLVAFLAFVGVRHLMLARHVACRLAESEARFRDLAESSADWFWEADAEQRFTWVSHRFEGVMGIGTATLIGRTRLDVASGDRATEAWRRHLEQLDQRRPFRDFEYDTETPRGPRVIRVSGVPVFGQDGRFLGYRGSASDVTDRAADKLRLAEALQQAEAASHAKSAFLAQMSHELRTPLNAIIGFAEMISIQAFGPAAGERYRGYAVDILASGRHLLSLVNDLLDIGRIEAGVRRIEAEETEVGPLVAESIGMVAGQAQAAGVSLTAALPSDLPMLFADPRALTQVVVNLLSNAIKFTPAGGRVTVTARIDEQDAMLIAVADTGIGIGPEDMARILRPFEQVEETFTRARGGAGLGLPISKGLMHLHGGTLTIDSAPERGTIVTCRFPPERVSRPPA